MGFLHRDVKHDNILLSSKDTMRCKEFVLIDFGLSIKYLNEDGSHYTFGEE